MNTILSKLTVLLVLFALVGVALIATAPQATATNATQGYTRQLTSPFSGWLKFNTYTFAGGAAGKSMDTVYFPFTHPRPSLALGSMDTVITYCTILGLNVGADTVHIRSYFDASTDNFATYTRFTLYNDSSTTSGGYFRRGFMLTRNAHGGFMPYSRILCIGDTTAPTVTKNSIGAQVRVDLVDQNY